MAKRQILSDESLLEGAQSIAADMELPGGRRLKLAKVIEDHLGWFEKARARGLEWSDIVDVLFKAGVARSDGRPLSRGHVSSLVWRKQNAVDRDEISSARSDPKPFAAAEIATDDLNNGGGALPTDHAAPEHSSGEHHKHPKSKRSVSSSRGKAIKTTKKHPIAARSSRSCGGRRDFAKTNSVDRRAVSTTAPVRRF